MYLCISTDVLFDLFQVDENITIPEWARNIFPEPWLSASMPFFVVPTFNEPLKRLFMGERGFKRISVLL